MPPVTQPIIASGVTDGALPPVSRTMMAHDATDTDDDIQVSTVNNLTQKELSSLLSNVISNYDECDEKLKTLVGALAVNLEKVSKNQRQNELVSSDDTSSDKKVMDIVTESLLVYKSEFSSERKSSGMRFPSNTPSQTMIKQQSQLRKMKTSEKETRRKKKLRILPPQQQTTPELPQKMKRKCAFCLSNECSSTHSCEKRSNYKRNGFEVDLTEPNQYSQLKTRIETAMPVAVSPPDITCLNSIGKKHDRQHMVLHEAYSAFASPSFSYMPITNMCFKVSFIDEHGNIPHNSKHMCLTGQCLERIFGKNAALRSKNIKRLVYDNTVHVPMNSNWTSRKIMSYQMQMIRIMPDVL